MGSSGSQGRRMSSAHVVSFVALFVALGSGAYAATVAPKDSVNSNSVKDETLLSQDVKDGTLRGKDVAPDGLGGLKIKESTLSTVPHAANADNAVNATKAGTATSANSANSAGTAATATNALNLGGRPPSAFATVAKFQRVTFTLNDNTTGDGADTRDLVTTATLRVIASCENTGGGAVTGKITIKSPSSGWDMDAFGGTENAAAISDQTNISGATEKTISTFGPTVNRHIATASYSAHLSAVQIDGIATVDVHPGNGSTLCGFSSGAFINQPS